MPAAASVDCIIFGAALTGWVANDARRRGRRWIRWGVATALVGLIGLVAWLVVRRRAPVVRDQPERRIAALIYTAAFCLALLQATSTVVIRTFGYQVARVEGRAMASTLDDQDRLLIEKWRYVLGVPRRGDICDAPVSTTTGKVVCEAHHRGAG